MRASYAVAAVVPTLPARHHGGAERTAPHFRGFLGADLVGISLTIVPVTYAWKREMMRSMHTLSVSMLP